MNDEGGMMKVWNDEFGMMNDELKAEAEVTDSSFITHHSSFASEVTHLSCLSLLGADAYQGQVFLPLITDLSRQSVIVVG